MRNEPLLPQLAEGWEWSTLGDVFSEMKNGTTSTQNKEGWGIPVTRIETVQNARFDLQRIGYVDDASPELIRTFQYHNGDIAFSHINSLPHVGKTALYEGVPEVLLHGMNLLRLRLGHDSLHPRFLHAAMQESFFREEVRDRVGRAVNQVSINQKKLSEVPLPIAPVAEQTRIVAKLGELLAHVNSARDHLSRVPVILKRFRQAVLAAACSGCLTEDWRLHHTPRTPSDGFLGGILAKRADRAKQCGIRVAREPAKADLSQLSDVPEDWAVTNIDQLSCVVTSGSRGWAKYYSASGRLFIRAQDINTDRLLTDGIAHVQPPNNAEGIRTRVCLGALLITITGANVTKSALVDRNIGDSYVSQHVALVRLIEPFIGPFLHLWTVSPLHGRAKLLDDAYGAGKPGLNLDNIKEMTVALPSPDEQVEIVHRVKSLFSLADNIEGHASKAARGADKLTQSILAKAFSGELVPTEADLARREGRDYEPASVLLERIRAGRADKASAPAGAKRKPRKASAHV